MRVPKTLTEKLLNVPVGQSPKGDFICMKTTVETNEFNLREEQARQTFIEKCQTGLISLHIWNGNREWSFQDWLRSGRTEAQFFFNTTDSGYVRVRRSPGLLGLMAYSAR
jgi:hypothetical protein